MLKKSLNRAIKLYDSTPGIEMVDAYFNSLYREEIAELKLFLSVVINDIRKSYKNDVTKEYLDKTTKEYVGQLSEIHQCIFIFNINNEGGETIKEPCATDILMKFRTFQKSTWVDQFIINGTGYDKGISIKELDEWELLMNFIINKKIDSAKAMPTSADIIAEKIDNIIMIDLNKVE